MNWPVTANFNSDPNMSKTFKTEGIILKRSNYGEADRILTIFTKHYGKIKVIAKGVRRISSRKGGNVEAFNQVSLFLVQGKNLDLVTEAEVVDSFRSWRKDLKKVGLAYYFCELVDKLTPEGQANRAVFELLLGYLKKLSFGLDYRLVRSFEEELLGELGFGVPQAFKNTPGSLKSYIESIVEKKINSPKILVRIDRP